MPKTLNPQSGYTLVAILVWGLIMVGFAAFFHYLIDNINNPNQHIQGRVTQSGQAQVSLKRNSMGHYVANGQINGKPVIFLLDTSATNVSVPAEVALRLGLIKNVPFYVNTANGVIEVYSTDIDKLSLGNITMSDVKGSINPYMGGEEILLGMSFLKHFELVQRGDILTITVP